MEPAVGTIRPPAVYLPRTNWSRDRESNPEPTVYDTVALPIELSRHLSKLKSSWCGAIRFYYPYSASKDAVADEA